MKRLNASRLVKTIVMLGIVSLCGMGLFKKTGLAAYLESDHKTTTADAPRVDPPPRILPPPRPHPRPPIVGNALHRLVRQIEVGDPEHYRGLTVFPLRLNAGGASSGLRSLDEALSHDWISIREMDRPQAGGLSVRNDSRHTVFLMSGEILLGGKQNRIVKDDVLLPPRSRFIDISVYCGEKDRWNTPIAKYKSAPGLANDRLRKMASRASPQATIWSEIDTQLESSKISSSTRNYGKIYEDKKINREMSDCVTYFRRCWRSRTVGAVVYARGTMLSCDLFSDPDLFSKLKDKICRSWAMETIYGGGKNSRRKVIAYPGKNEVQRILNQALRSRLSSRHTPGVGQLYRVSNGVEGHALIWENQVVHAAIYPSGFRIYK